LSQRAPGGIDKRIPPSVQRGRFRETERVVDQSVGRNLKVDFGASRVLDSLGSEDGTQRLLAFENQGFRILGKMLQMDFAGAKSHWDLAAFRDQDHLP
jgi:hypothetical protein